MFVCPKRRLTVSMGTPCDKKHGRGVRVSCNMVGQTHLETALSAYIFEYLVTTAVARNGENMTVPSQSLVFLDDTIGNVKRRMFDSVLVFFLRVIIQRLPSKNVCRRSSVRFFTSEYAKPVKTEKTNKSRTARGWRSSSVRP